LIDPSALARWLRERRLLADHVRLTAVERERALSLREGLRALVFANNGRPPDAPAIGRLHHASAGAHTEVRLDVDGPAFRAPIPSTLDGALGVLLAISAGAMLDGTWPRLKACPGRNCAWVFYERTRNQSARWCAMKVCGDREKARAYYEPRNKNTHNGAPDQPPNAPATDSHHGPAQIHTTALRLRRSRHVRPAPIGLRHGGRRHVARLRLAREAGLPHARRSTRRRPPRSVSQGPHRNRSLRSTRRCREPICACWSPDDGRGRHGPRDFRVRRYSFAHRRRPPTLRVANAGRRATPLTSPRRIRSPR
jgi:predicted RNA-binding Zn ribbon-like protein